MEFFINKNATLPVLKLQLIQDGRNDYQKFFEQIQNANVVFSMSDTVTGVKKPAGFMLADNSDCSSEEYYITYQFNSKETAKAGRYVGQMEINFLDGTGVLIAPIREQLYINILEGDIKSC
jgi:hypothetical protein